MNDTETVVFESTEAVVEAAPVEVVAEAVVETTPAEAVVETTPAEAAPAEAAVEAVPVEAVVEAAPAEIVPVAAAVKTPSKKSQAVAIFQAKLADRREGKFALNKDFRAAVLTAIQAELGVSIASAATMYNTAKKEAEVADATIQLGRDPKQEKAPSTGKRGRPAGSGKKATEVVPTEATEVAPTEVAPTEPVELVLPVETEVAPVELILPVETEVAPVEVETVNA